MTLRLFYASFCNIFKVYFTAAFILFYFILFYMCERLYVGCNGITGEVSFACDVSVVGICFSCFFTAGLAPVRLFYLRVICSSRFFRGREAFILDFCHYYPNETNFSCLLPRVAYNSRRCNFILP